MFQDEVSILLFSLGALGAAMILILNKVNKQEKRINQLSEIVVSSLGAMSILAKSHRELAIALKQLAIDLGDSVEKASQAAEAVKEFVDSESERT